MVRRLAVLCAPLSLFVLAACTSLLGDFEVGPTSVSDGGPTIQSSDGAVTPAEDGGPDASVRLRCQIAGVPRLVDKAPGAAFQTPVRAFRVGNQTRAITTKKGESGFWVYAIGNGDSTPPRLVPLAGRFFDVRQIPGGIGVLAAGPPETTGGGEPLVLHKIPESGGANEPAPEALTAAVVGGINSATFAAFGVDDYFVSATVPVGLNAAEVRAARRKPMTKPATLHVVGSGTSDGETRIANIARGTGRAYLFNDKGPEQGNLGGAGYFTVPDDPVAATSAKAVQLMRQGRRPIATFAVGQGKDAIGLALAEIDFTAGSADLLVGALPFNALDPIDPGTLPVAFTLTSFFDAPVGGGDARFVDANFFAIGSPIGGSGLNFYWYDGQAAAMRAVQIGAEKLLADRTIASSTLAPRSVLGGLAEIDLVWTEEPGKGTTDGTLWTAPLACAK